MGKEIPGLEKVDKPPIESFLAFDGRRAMVTGAAGSIGGAVARRLAEAGADLVLVDIDGEGLKRLAKELQDYGVGIDARVVDVTRKSEVDRLWEDLSEDPPELLVNSTSLYARKGLGEVEESFLDWSFRINAASTLWMCRGIIESRKGLGGAIVNVTSIEAVVPYKRDLAVYSMGAMSVISLTRALARDFGDEFRVNTVLIGGIATEGYLKYLREGDERAIEELKAMLGRTPSRRLGDPDEVARVILFLLSDLASYVNGVVIPVDGGFLST